MCPEFEVNGKKFNAANATSAEDAYLKEYHMRRSDLGKGGVFLSVTVPGNYFGSDAERNDPREQEQRRFRASQTRQWDNGDHYKPSVVESVGGFLGELADLFS